MTDLPKPPFWRPGVPKPPFRRPGVPEQERPPAGSVKRCVKPATVLGSERGQITLFGLGIVVMLLAIGGFALDLWRVLDERRSLAELADAAAAAGANGIDHQHYRDHGVVELDPVVAEAFARDNLAGQVAPAALIEPPLIVATDGTVTVTVQGRVELTLLGVFTSGGGIDLEVVAVAGPRRGGN